MAFAYEVYCYYNVDTLEAVFNGVAMIINGGGYSTLVKIVLLLGMFTMAMVSLGTGKFEGMKWIVVVSVFYVGFLGPKTNIILVDRITAQPPKVVANIPLGLAFMAHFTSYTGDWITTTMESAFTVLPDSLTFGAGRISTNTGETHGLMFGAKLLSETRRAVIGDPNLRMDWYAFIRNCTIYDVAPGGRINIDTLQKSQDIITTLGDTSPARITTLYDPANPAGPAQVTCLEAHGYLKARLSLDVANQANVFGRSLNPNISATTPNAAVLAIYNTQASEITQLMLANSRNAVDTIQQAMAINLMDSSGAVIGQQLNDPSSVQIALAQAQAEATANSSYATMAKVAEGAMPKIRNVIEVVVYATFPIVMLIILVAGHRAGAPLKAYFMTMVWLQLWPPLYAILNLVVSIETAKQTIAAAVAQGGGLTIASAADIGAVSLSSQAIAGYMVMLIPVIAGAITKGGEQAMSSLASSLTAPSQQAASQAGTQAATGNLSYGNTSLDTHSAHNTAMNSNASSFRADAPTAVQVDGVGGHRYKISGGGTPTVDENKNNLVGTAALMNDSSQSHRRSSEAASVEAEKNASSIGKGATSIYQSVTGSGFDKMSGKGITFSNNSGTQTVNQQSLEHMKSVVAEDAKSVGMSETDYVQFQAAVKAGGNAGKILNNMAVGKGADRGGFLDGIAKALDIEGGSSETIGAKLEDKLSQTRKSSSGEAYKTLDTITSATDVSFNSSDTTGYSKKASQGLSASIANTKDARSSYERSRTKQHTESEAASAEEKVGRMLGTDVYSGSKLDKNLKGLGLEGGVFQFLDLAPAERLQYAKKLVDAEANGAFSPVNARFNEAQQRIEDAIPTGSPDSTFKNGEKIAITDHAANKSRASAFAPGFTSKELDGSQRYLMDLNQGNYADASGKIDLGNSSLTMAGNKLRSDTNKATSEKPADVAAQKVLDRLKPEGPEDYVNAANGLLYAADPALGALTYAARKTGEKAVEVLDRNTRIISDMAPQGNLGMPNTPENRALLEKYEQESKKAHGK